MQYLFAHAGAHPATRMYRKNAAGVKFP